MDGPTLTRCHRHLWAHRHSELTMSQHRSSDPMQDRLASPPQPVALPPLHKGAPAHLKRFRSVQSDPALDTHTCIHVISSRHVTQKLWNAN